jgi:S-adenosylmethionine/arginine decarboxylase-like enzyme
MTKDTIQLYFDELCDLIGMVKCDAHYWEEEHITKEELANCPHLVGVSAVQFIKTSNVTIHTISGLGNVYINIFSCKDFDARLAEGFSIGFWDGKKVNCVVMDRV